MSFALKCPKCASGNIVIEQDSRSYFQRAVPSLHCLMCGKIVYGEEAIETEYLHQKEAYEAAQVKVESAPVVAAEPAPEVQIPETLPTLPTPEEPEPVAATGRITEVGSREETPGVCAWQGCSKPARQTSKYCSRTCSNKNARWRHAQRGKRDVVKGLSVASVATLRESQSISG